MEHEKVRKALQAMERITTKPWTIERSAIYRLEERLTPEDREKYPIRSDIDIEAYVLCAAAAAKKYCISDSNAKIIRNLKRLLVAIFAGVFAYLFLMTLKT